MTSEQIRNSTMIEVRDDHGITAKLAAERNVWLQEIALQLAEANDLHSMIEGVVSPSTPTPQSLYTLQPPPAQSVHLVTLLDRLNVLRTEGKLSEDATAALRDFTESEADDDIPF